MFQKGYRKVVTVGTTEGKKEKGKREMRNEGPTAVGRANQPSGC